MKNMLAPSDKKARKIIDNSPLTTVERSATRNEKDDDADGYQPASPGKDGGTDEFTCPAKEKADLAMKKLTTHSTFFRDYNVETGIVRRFDRSEVHIDHNDVLGKGGFAVVSKGTLKGRYDEDCDIVYAFKQLQPELAKKRPRQFASGAADLAMEAAFLEQLRDHPHIVDIVGVAADRNFTDTEDNEPFFLVLEQLQGTMSSRLEKWQKEDQELGRSYSKLLANLKDRLLLATDIAETIEFLHSKNILYRDLKLENIGFAADGAVKIFDLGLCKEIKELAENGKYELTGNTGSQRYMAPEVAKSWSYGFPVDVYSFSILLWEIAACRRAFDEFTCEEDFQYHVLHGEERPPMEEWWPVELQWLLKKGWSFFASARPAMSVIVETLKEIVEDIGDELGKADNGRRVFRFGSNFGRMKRKSESRRSHTKSCNDVVVDGKSNCGTAHELVKRKEGNLRKLLQVASAQSSILSSQSQLRSTDKGYANDYGDSDESNSGHELVGSRRRFRFAFGRKRRSHQELQHSASSNMEEEVLFGDASDQAHLDTSVGGSVFQFVFQLGHPSNERNQLTPVTCDEQVMFDESMDDGSSPQCDMQLSSFSNHSEVQNPNVLVEEFDTQDEAMKDSDAKPFSLVGMGLMRFTGERRCVRKEKKDMKHLKPVRDEGPVLMSSSFSHRSYFHKANAMRGRRQKQRRQQKHGRPPHDDLPESAPPPPPVRAPFGWFRNE